MVGEPNCLLVRRCARVLLGCWLVACGCGSESSPRASRQLGSWSARQAAEPGRERLASGAPEVFGRAISQRPGVSLGALLADPRGYAGRVVTLAGTVRRVCQRRGCWLELAEEHDQRLPGCRVTFKDYAFFVPTDSAGSRARVEAEVAVRHVTREQVAHLEGEGAQFSRKLPDGSAEEVQLIASGVELWRRR
ncbi:MAG: DUF4920 domain-containing protein [Proteobacteria bacterium]|nr:DUF4920 domain-containing protein [Pseudomonadota bacterium]